MRIISFRLRYTIKLLTGCDEKHEAGFFVKEMNFDLNKYIFSILRKNTGEEKQEI